MFSPATWPFPITQQNAIHTVHQRSRPSVDTIFANSMVFTILRYLRHTARKSNNKTPFPISYCSNRSTGTDSGSPQLITAPVYLLPRPTMLLVADTLHQDIRRKAGTRPSLLLP